MAGKSASWLDCLIVQGSQSDATSQWQKTTTTHKTTTLLNKQSVIPVNIPFFPIHFRPTYRFSPKMAADFYLLLYFFTVFWPPSFVLLLSHLKPNGIFHLTPSAERHPAFIFNIRRLLIIKGMYLNYKYTSYTEVGKAGI